MAALGVKNAGGVRGMLLGSYGETQHLVSVS
jgi:hypothetical protein